MSFKSISKSFLLFLLIFTSCENYNNGLDNITNESNQVNSRIASFENIELENAPSQYSVILISDTHFSSGDFYKNANDFLSMIEENRIPAKYPILFAIDLGDLTNGGTEEEYKRYNMFKSKIENFGISLYTIPGNHDFYDSGNSGRNYQKYINETTFYRVSTKSSSFYFLDSADGFFGNKQLEKLNMLLNFDSNIKILLSHYPLYTKDLTSKLVDLNERVALASLIKNQSVSYMFCGHVHNWESHKFNNFEEVVLGSFKQNKAGFVILNIDEINKKQDYEIVLFK